MEKKLLKGLYDCFYAPPELSEQEEEVTACHKALIEALAKPERKLLLRKEVMQKFAGGALAVEHQDWVLLQIL